MTGPLERRAVDIARLADGRWDLLVVGGGIVGAVAAYLEGARREFAVPPGT
jgi:glycerol-3-phosphate dehydrogenase